MKLSRDKIDPHHLAEMKRALLSLVGLTSTPSSRPCDNCNRVCPTCGSTSYICNCVHTCEHAAASPSSEVDVYPIEPGIVPFVYAVSLLPGCWPYWLYEVHAGEGPADKPPRVWFYTRSVVQIRLINDHMSQLFIKKIAGTPWRVQVTNSDQDNPDTGFSIEPDLANGGDVSLEGLRRDVLKITETLNEGVSTAAEKLDSGLA